MTARPDCIRHSREIQWPDDEHYPGSNERASIRAGVGERGPGGDRVHCPPHTQRNAAIGPAPWRDAPTALRGTRDARPGLLRANPPDRH